MANYLSSHTGAQIDAFDTAIQGKVAKAGDTMSGNLTISRSGGESGIYIQDPDKGNNKISLITATGGNAGIYSNGYWDGSAFVSNGKYLIYRQAETGDICINGFVSKNSCVIDNNYSVIINSNIANDSDPSSDTYSGSFQIRTNDDDRVAIGFLQAMKQTNGTQGIQLSARRRINGTNYNSALYLRVNASGQSMAHFTAKQIILNNGYYGGYIDCTRNAAFCVGAAPNTSSGALSALSVRTPSGAWCINTYTGEQLQFTYGTTTNYNAGTNTVVTAKITAAGAFTNASKRELKENIEDYTDSAIDIINSTKICSFNMKGDPEKDFRVGFIADDTDPVLSGKNQDVMDNQNCIGVLLKAVQELQQEINNLQQEINNLKQQVYNE